MRRVRTRLMLVAVVAAAALVGAGSGPTGAATKAGTHRKELTAGSPITVVAGGLRSPRSLAWGPHGHLLVSEAGAPPMTAPSVCNFDSQVITLDLSCYGHTGSIAYIAGGRPVRIATGLASNLNEQEMVGPNGLAYVNGRIYTLETGSPQAVPSWLPTDLATALKKEYGALISVAGRHTSVIANPGRVDYDWAVAHPELVNPPSARPNNYPAANPYAMTPRPDGGFYLVDAASNTLDSVDRHGNVHVLAFIPNTAAGPNAVPSCVDVGPDGAVYVGEITGHGNSATAANVYRYAPWSGSLKVWQSGFSAINGCGFGANGDFYVTELDTTGFLPTGDPDGAVIQIGRDGKRTVLGEGKLFAPSGFLAGPDGSIYVANNTIWWPAGTTDRASGGEIVKIG